MAVRKRGEYYQGDITSNGVRHRHQFTTFEDAQEWETEAKLARKLGRQIPSPKKLSVDGGFSMRNVADAVWSERWSSNKDGDRSMLLADQAAEFFGPARDIRSLTRSDITKFVSHLSDEFENSGPTINKKLSALNTMMSYAAEADEKYRKPKMPWQRRGEFKPKIVSQDDETRILATLHLWGQPRLFDLTVALLDTGARVGELLKLKWSGIKGNLIQLGGKNDQYRNIPMTERVREAVDRARSLGIKEGPFRDIDYTNYRYIWQKMREHLDLEDVRIHSLRHTCCSRLVASGMDAFRVMKWMGHRNIATTQKYVTLYPSDLEELREVLERRPRLVG